MISIIHRPRVRPFKQSAQLRVPCSRVCVTLPHPCFTEKQYLWRDPVFVDLFGADFFPPNFTSQSRINGLEGVNRSIDLVLRVGIPPIHALLTHHWA